MTKDEDNIVLIYVGNGSFIPGVPARSLTKNEAAKFSRSLLVSSGLYKPVKKSKIEPKSED